MLHSMSPSKSPEKLQCRNGYQRGGVREGGEKKLNQKVRLGDAAYLGLVMALAHALHYLDSHLLSHEEW